MRRIALYCFLLVTVLSLTAVAKQKMEKGANRKLKDKVILVVRHCEKPDRGDGLDSKGKRRAEAYVDYFKNYQIDGEPLKLGHLYAAADTKESHRSRLTLEPLAKSLGMLVDCRFGDDNFEQLADDIHSRTREKMVLIAWHHENLPELLRSLGADPNQLLPDGKWPDHQFGWVIDLRYDHDGQLLESTRVDENLNLAPPPKVKGWHHLKKQ